MADYEDTSNSKVKKRKIRRSDWQKVEEYLKKELDKRKTSTYRKNKERVWAEIDRQIAMEPMKKFGPGGKELPPSWQSAFELGELSKASEVIAADVIRLVFPQNRTWFETHIKPPSTVDPQTGRPKVGVDQKKQKLADGLLRALMSQQHIDFGLRARFKLSVKEALHHGGMVATIDWESQNKVYDGQGLESLEAPVWTPHSMWNSYPDPSPSVIPGGGIFYTGSMMITSYMPRHKVLALRGENYMNLDDKKIPKRKNKNKDTETEDVEIVTYYGDLVIDREDGDIYLPNSKCKTANGVVIYYAANTLPFPEVIYAGYERQDVRDPYFTSPIEKNSPMQKVATILANKFIDSVDLHTVPPIVYDGNDPYMVQNGGVNLWPGAQTPSKGSNKFQEVKVGDPKAAMMGLQMALTKLEEGTAVNAIRSGAGDSDRKTATEVRNTQMGSEIRTVDFVGDLENSGLRVFLYMQHEMNLKNLKQYSFYCQEKGLPDFITITKKDMPQIVHFEVVGSKGVLGEERRSQQMTAVTAFASQNPLFAPLLNAPDILIDMYEDAGVKGAESYVKTEKPQIPPQAQMQMQQMQEAIQKLQAELQKAKAGEEVQLRKIELEKMKFQADIAAERARLELEKVRAVSDMKSDAAQVVQSANEAIAKLDLQQQEMDRKFALEHDKIRADYAIKVQQMEQDRQLEREQMKAEKQDAEDKVKKATRKVKVKRLPDGFEIEGAKIVKTASGYEIQEG